VVVLSLVINFVGDPRRKGEMLVRCRTLVRDGGNLFIVLPLACMDNSRYIPLLSR
jgi:25S rRNA (adenine2142-N1)-methyltransferase